MQNIRPSILLRSRRPSSRSGAESANDAWKDEEKRLEARRARRYGYEQDFRLSHSGQCDVTQPEMRARVVSLRKAHDQLHNAREQKKENEKEMDRQFALNQASVAAQKAAEEDARNRQKKAEAYAAGALNRKIAEEKRQKQMVHRRVENQTDNAMIQESLSAKRTFLY